MVWGKKKKDKPEEPEELIDDGVDELDDDWDDFVEEDESPKGTRKERFLRGLRNGVIAAVVMVVIVGGAGAGYIWYLGENSPPSEAAIAKAVEPGVKKEVKPLQRDPNAPFGASIQMLSTPVLPGDNAGVTIKSVADVSCKVVVEINKVALKDSGLVEKATDEYGVLAWSWTIPADAPVGKAPVKITCVSAAKKSAYVEGMMDIVKTLPQD